MGLASGEEEGLRKLGSGINSLLHAAQKPRLECANCTALAEKVGEVRGALKEAIERADVAEDAHQEAAAQMAAC